MTKQGAAVLLVPGETLTAQLSEGEVRAYSVVVPAGDLLHLVVDQQGVDVVLAVRRPGGEVMLEVDSPNRNWGSEDLWWIAPEGGVWRLEVRPWRPAPDGRYRLRDVAIDIPDSRDRLRAAAWQAIRRAERSRAAGDIPAARRELVAAREVWRRVGEPLQEALAEIRIAEVATASGDATGEASSYQSALALFRRLGDGRQEIYALLRLGEARRRAGDLDGAWRAEAEALRLARLCGVGSDEAAALNNQALILEAKGETRAALELYRRSLAVFRALGDRDETATTLYNLGVSSSLLGLLDSAETALTESLALRRALTDVRGQGAALTELGWVYRLRALESGGKEAIQDREKARALFEQALTCRRAAYDETGEAGTLDRLGTVYRDGGRWDEALSSYQRSLDLTLRSPPGRELANSLTNLAELWLDRGDPAAAHRFAARAVARFTALRARDLHGEAHARYLLGRAAASLGDAKNARLELEHALSMVEAQRAELGDQTLTLPFFALRQLYFEGTIEAFMALAASHPGSDFAWAALETSERSRMRTLLDSLVERRERDRGARSRDEVRPVTADQIRELLDDDTVLLEYFLGEERGFLWVVERGGLSTYPIPGRRVLEIQVRQVYKSLSRSGGDLAAARRLSQMLLAPVADRLGSRRLAVVTDGLLAYVPFAVLPWGLDGQPLMSRHEIVRLPSATTLAALRRRASARPATAGVRAAVLADPVFSPLDQRVHRSGTAPIAQEPGDRAELTRSVHDLGLRDLLRLPATRHEAETIAALAPGSFVALDFAARRETLTSAAVRNARILHLATHGLLNPTNPALSGIVLSLVDEQGHAREGFLRADEIAGLELKADLVVLSACKTALGPEVRGEGLLGLARAFLRAGAKQVLVSLWNIDDRSSAVLMERFYEGLLREKLPPAAALRRAQLSLRGDPKWADPCRWAGFELQGDWR